MKKIFIRLLSALLVTLIISSCSSPKITKIDLNGEESLDEIILKTADKFMEILDISGKDEKTVLSDNDIFKAGTSLYDWAAMSLYLSGKELDYDDYVNNLKDYVTNSYKENGGLSKTKATEWTRLIIVLNSLGFDPTSFGTDTNGDPINLVADGTYNYINGDLGKQGVNGYAYALIALNYGNYEVPENALYSENDMISAILESQNDDGGFSLQKGSDSEADLTAIIITGLSWYKDNSKVNETIEKAIDYLVTSQNDEGLYLYYGAYPAESIATVITALTSVGIDPESDERFNKKNYIANTLCEFSKDYGFIHTLDSENYDYYATEQSLLALLSIKSFRENKTSIYY